MLLTKSWSLKRNVISAAAAILALAAAPLAAQVTAPGNNKPLPPSAQKAPPFQQGGGNFNAVLQGEYIYSGSAACLVSLSGEFTPDFRPTGNFFSNAFGVNGIRVFNGDGTGTVRGRTLSISGAAGSNRFEGEFTYHVNPDLTIEITTQTSTTVILTGPSAGQTQVLHGPIVMRGSITEDLSTIHAMQYDPQIETVTLDETVLNRRICYRDRTFTRLKRAR